MTNSDNTFTNPVSGHQVTFLQTGAESNGELLQLEYVVPGREEPLHYIPLHFHDKAKERFEVRSGRLGVMLDNKNNRRMLEAGHAVTIPPGKVHAFWNDGDEELRFLTDIRPAGQMQTYWETAFGLAAEGKVNDKGIVRFWQLAALFPVMDTYAAGAPAGLQKAIFTPLGWVGGLLGYRASYPRFSRATGDGRTQTAG